MNKNPAGCCAADAGSGAPVDSRTPAGKAPARSSEAAVSGRNGADEGTLAAILLGRAS